MPFTFYGTGTMLIGERDYAADGSYLTTEWFVIFCLPLLPLRSLRVIPAGADPRWPVFRQSYRLIAESSPSPRHAISVYAFAAAFAGWLVCWWQAVGLLAKLAPLGELVAPVAFLVMVLAIILSPFAVPLYLRRRARGRAGVVTKCSASRASHAGTCPRCSGKGLVAVYLAQKAGVFFERCAACSEASPNTE